MRLSIAEGMCYALMVGFGEAYFLADAVRLGASAFEAALVVSLPLFTGAMGPMIALRLLARFGRRRELVAAANLCQAGVLLALGLATGAGSLTPRWLIAGACAYQVFGQAAGTAWSSWFGDLVPKSVRGRYFARRNRGVHVATLTSLLCGGLLLEWLEPETAGAAAGVGGSGFQLIFLLAAGARFLSAVLIAITAEPRFHGLSSRERVGRYLRTARGSSAWRFLTVGALLQVVVYFSSPFFAPFMLETLRFSYLEYTIATVCVVAFKVGFLPIWGRLIDQHGPRQVYGLALLGVALIPLPFLLSRGLGMVLVAQAVSGIAWAGHELSQFALLLDSSYKRTRPQLFAAQSLLNGSAQLVGCLAAGPFLGLVDGNLRMVFLVSMIGRLAVGLALPRLLPVQHGPTLPTRRELLLRVIGIRAHGGLVHRPLDDMKDGRERPPREHTGSGAAASKDSAKD